MAPTHVVVADAVAVSHPDAELARRAATSFVRPQKNSEQIAEDLLRRLVKTKLRRESRGLNHWEEFAPAYLQKVLARHESRRRAGIESFFRIERDKAIARATAMLGDREDAEEIVGETFLELMEGRTAVGHFYRALWANLVNRWEKVQKESSSFVSIEKVVMSAGASGSAEAGSEGGGDAVEDFSSFRPDDQDPLDILIAREERAESRRMVQDAMRDPRWRYIKRRDWAAGIEENVRN
jgi:DNA-directed RNA polymerase specialized sigma24 family protein